MHCLVIILKSYFKLPKIILLNHNETRQNIKKILQNILRIFIILNAGVNLQRIVYYKILIY